MADHKNEIVGKIEHLECGNVFFTFDNSINLDKFKNINSYCECCKKRIYRKYSYLIKLEDNSIIQVGKNCINHYIEKNQECDVIDYDKMVLCCDFDFDVMFSMGKSKYINLETFIYTLIYYKGDLKEFDYANLWAEKKAVIDNYIIENEADLQQTFNNIINYFKNTNFNNDFNNNIKSIILSNSSLFFELKYINIMKYAYKCYNDYIKYLDINNNSKGLTNNTFIIKDIFLEKEELNYNYSYYGVLEKTYKIIDTDNNIIELITSSSKDLTNLKGKKCTCEIKKQYNSKNGKITIIKKLKAC